MRQQVKAALLGCGAAALVAARAPANATVYNVNETIGLGAVVGTITTDGATGTISPSDFTAWGLQLVGLGVTTIITSADMGAKALGRASTSPLTPRMSLSTSPETTAAFSSFRTSWAAGTPIGASIPPMADASKTNPWFRKTSGTGARSLRPEAASR